MKDLLTYIFCSIAQKERARINEADSNPNKWYELFITYEDGSTQTFEKAETFAGIIVNVEKYVVEYKFDNINIDIWENNNDKPQNIYTFFTTPLIYGLIHDYFRYQNKLKNMRFVGKIIFPEDGSVPQFKKACYNYGEEAEIFINEIAFEYFNNLCCYIPDMGSEDDEPDWCTCGDFLYTANDNKEIARRLFDEVTWEYPSTLYDQWECHGTLDEHEKNMNTQLKIEAGDEKDVVIAKIKNILSVYDSFSVCDVEADCSPSIYGSGSISVLTEDFYMEYVTAYTYHSKIDDAVSEEDIPYEKVEIGVLKEIYELALVWEQLNINE